MAENFHKIVDEFKTGCPEGQHAAFRKLVALKMHHKASSLPEFRAGLDRALSVATSADSSDIHRLFAVATMGRVASTIRSLRPTLQDVLAEALVDELPSPALLEDVEDRTTVGEVCAIAAKPWVPRYAATAMVFEESGEQARLAFARALLRSTQDLEGALICLAEQLQAWVPQTEEPGNTVTRRTRRILATLRYAIGDTLPESGDEPGAVLADVIKKAYYAVSAPTSHDALLDTADELAGVVHEMVRLRFSLATTSSTYSALGAIKAQIQPQKWRQVAQSSKNIAVVASDITEAILVVARQGVTDSGLVTHLSTASGGETFARERLRELAKKPGLLPEVRGWLSNGRLEIPKNIVPEAGESQKLAEDAVLGDLLVDACRYRIAEATGRQAILPEFEVLNPLLANDLKKLMNYSLGLCDAIVAIAKRRGLKLRGMPGDEEDYAPLDHEVIGNAAGCRRVTIIRPVVELIREDGVPFVVRKGLVQPVL